MRRFSEISGLAVVMRQTGRRIGKVERIAPSRDGQRVEGLILLAHGGLRKRRFVPLGSIALWGEVAVAVMSVQPLAQELRRRAELPGLPVHHDQTDDRVQHQHRDDQFRKDACLLEFHSLQNLPPDRICFQ